MKYFFPVVAFCTLPAFAFAAAKNVMDLAQWLVTIMNMATALLITTAVVIYFWGLVYNYQSLSKDPAKMRTFLWWGLFAIFIMVSIWGIVAMIKTSIQI